MAATSRRSAFVICVLLAIAFNVAALGALSGIVADWRSGGTAKSSTTSWITAVQVPPINTSPLLPTTTPSDSISNASSLPRPVPHTESPTVITAPAAQAEASKAPVRFYRFAEVDKPAQPDSDWSLDTAALDTAGVSRLVFQVFVDSEGKIVDCSILEPRTLNALSRKSLEDRLKQTTLTPALRAGVAVASVRKIEVSILPSE